MTADTKPAGAMELRPCPFCGSAAIVLKDHRQIGFYVACINCNVAGETTTKAFAIEAWNTRALPAEAGIVPEGWQLVPKQCTQNMADAAVVGSRADVSYDDIEHLWPAMLEAAPKLPIAPPAIWERVRETLQRIADFPHDGSASAQGMTQLARDALESLALSPPAERLGTLDDIRLKLKETCGALERCSCADGNRQWYSADCARVIAAAVLPALTQQDRS